MHLGFGAFARAHPILHTDLANEVTGGDWGVAVARLNSGEALLSELDTAGRFYTVAETDDAGLMARRVACVTQTLHPRRDGPDAIPDLIAAADLRIISLTVTEKGYCLAGDTLDLKHPQIQCDLAAQTTPKTAIGTIVEGLRRRRVARQGGLTVLSCDNLPANGNMCRNAVLGLAHARDRELAEWIAANCRFPSTMVDRIVPALDDDARATLHEVLGRDDPNGILCEPFRQWVIEDDIANGCPDWAAAGAELVRDVAPYEEMKLRMLNGAHSALAYLGALHGHATIADCMADDVFRDAAYRLMLTEQAPTLSMPDTVDLAGYASQLINRFSNSRLHHKTTQIAMDGSQKLPQRLLSSCADNLEQGRDWPLTALAVAAWMRYIRGVDENGVAVPVQDPMAGDFARLASAGDGVQYVESLLDLDQVFPPTLAEQSGFRAAILRAYSRVEAMGARGAILESLTQGEGGT
nr:mannitol dehydrogenase family protein [Ruegeria sp. Ofav3-42]